MKKKSPAAGRIYDECERGANHLRLLRDFTSQPGNVWLARGEVTKLAQVVANLEQLLDDLKDEEAQEQA